MKKKMETKKKEIGKKSATILRVRQKERGVGKRLKKERKKDQMNGGENEWKKRKRK